MSTAAASDGEGPTVAGLALRCGPAILVGVAFLAVFGLHSGDVWALITAGMGLAYAGSGVAAAALTLADREMDAVAALPAAATVAAVAVLLGGDLRDPVHFETGVALAGVLASLAFPLGYLRRERARQAVAVVIALCAVAIVGITVDMVTVPRLDDPPLPLVGGAILVLAGLAAGAPLYVLGDRTRGGGAAGPARHVPALAATLAALAAAGAAAGLFVAFEQRLLLEEPVRTVIGASVVLIGVPFVATAVALVRALRAR